MTAEDGTTLRAKVWIDGSYEGDLAFVGGASMVWGRESTAQYGEHGAGRRPVSLSYKTVDPYVLEPGGCTASVAIPVATC